MTKNPQALGLGLVPRALGLGLGSESIQGLLLLLIQCWKSTLISRH